MLLESPAPNRTALPVDRASASGRAADVIAIVVLVLLLASVYVATARPGQDWGGDFAQYVMHARNISTGRPYLENRYEITLAEAEIHMPASYPPVFPYILAPVYAKYGLNYRVLNLVPAALFLFAALASFWLARVRGLGTFPAAVVAGAFGLSGIVFAMKDSILSDSTYLVFAGLTLAVLAWIDKNGWDRTRPLVAAAMVVVPMLLAYGSRAIGISVAVAFVLREVWVIRRPRLFNLLVIAGFGVGVMLYARTLYDGRAYQTHFPFLPSAYLHNALFYLRTPASLWSGSPSVLRYLLLVVTFALAAWEWFQRIRKSPSVVEFYVLTVTGVVIVYALGYNTRYLMPVLPLYLIYFMEGVQRVRIPRATVLAAVLLTAGAAFNIRGMEKGPYATGVEQKSFSEVVAFVSTHGDPEQALVSWNPRVLALYTGYRSAWYPYTASDAEFQAYLKNIHAGFVLLYTKNEDDVLWLKPHLANPPVFQNSDFQLYDVGPQTSQTR